MKKSIRIAAALCAAVFLALALAGCTFGGDEENGGKVENRFAGKTIEYEDTDREEYEDGSWYEDYEYTKITFTKDTATGYSEWRYTSSYSEKVEEEKEEYQYTYVLESVNSKNVLHLTVKNPTITIGYDLPNGGEFYKEYTLDEYIEEYYVGISSSTKELLRKAESTYYSYYEFTDNNTVKWYDDYYVGDMTKSSERFSYDGYDSASSDEYDSVSFGRDRLRLRHYGSNDRVEYWGIPQLTGNTFTADMYRVDEIRDEQGSYREQYTSVGNITGNYAINGTGSKCTGTVSFTKFPDEMKDLFDNTYQIQNWDSDKYNEYDDDKYREFKIIN